MSRISTMSSCRNRALPSKFILQSSATTSSSLVTRRGLISARARIGVDVCLHQLLDEPDALLERLAFETERPGDLTCLKRLQPEDGVDGDSLDGRRILRRDFFDLHAALSGSHDDWLSEAAIERDPEVELLVEIERFLDQDLSHELTLGTGLVRDELHPEDLAGDLHSLVGILGELDAAALPTPSGVNLRFDDDSSAELFSGLSCVLSLLDDDSARYGNSVSAKDFFGLIFVHFHRVVIFITERDPERGEPSQGRAPRGGRTSPPESRRAPPLIPAKDAANAPEGTG